MISFLFCTVYSIFFGGLVAWLNEANGNPAHLTLRGKRVVFVFAIICGFFIYYGVSHFNVSCDLTPNKTTACQVGWF